MTDSAQDNLSDAPAANPNANDSDEIHSANSHGDLPTRILELETQLKEKESKYLYLYADFENFKKRAVKERSDLIKFGWEPTARELLNVLDNLERAVEHVPPGTDENFVAGLQMVSHQFRSTLEKQGVSPVRAENFDPNLHEAVGTEVSDRPAGSIVKEHTRGYLLHGRLLRPARVSVSGGPAPVSGGSGGE